MVVDLDGIDRVEGGQPVDHGEGQVAVATDLTALPEPVAIGRDPLDPWWPRVVAAQDLERLLELLGSGRSLSGPTQGAAPFVEDVGLVSGQAVALETRVSAAERHVRLVEMILGGKHDSLRESDVTDPGTPVLAVPNELGAALEMGARGGQAAAFGARPGEVGTYP